MTSTQQRRRQPAGTPSSVGGQFAAEASPAAAIDLTPTDHVEFERFRAQVRRSVQRRYGSSVDADDVIGIVHEAAAKHLSDGSWTNLRDNIPYLQRVAMGAAVNIYKPGQENGRTRKAAVQLQARISEFVQEHHRQPTSAEIDDIATRVRDSFPAGKKPASGFQHLLFHVSDLSLDATLGDDESDSSLADRLAHSPQEDTTAWDQLDAHRQDRFGVPGLSDDKIRALIWTTARKDNPDVPPLQRLTSARAASAAAELEQVGIAHTLREYEYEGAAAPGFAALMAPFGGIESTTPVQQAAVADTLGRYDGLGSHLWQLAAAQAQRA